MHIFENASYDTLSESHGSIPLPRFFLRFVDTSFPFVLSSSKCYDTSYTGCSAGV